MKFSIRRVFASLLLLLPVYTASAPLVLAQADSIVIQNDGAVNLVIEKQILGISVQAASPQSPKTVPVKVVPIVSGNTPSKVTVQATKQEDKKVTVTVTEKPAAKSPTTSSSVGTSPSAPAKPAKVISTQTVDRVVLQGANNTEVVSISKSGNTLLLQQEGTKATSDLSITVDSQTHALSAPASGGKETKLILPKVAADSLSHEGLLQINTVSPSSPQFTLSQDKTGDIIYSTQPSGKLFGVFSIPTPTVSISNETGKISSSPFARFLLPFFR